MFILTRKIGESLVVNHKITITVAIVGDNYADVGFFEHGLCTGRATLGTTQKSSLPAGLRGIMIRRTGRDSVQLGIDIPDGVTVERH